MENFNLSKLKEMSPTDAKAYIVKYFVPLTDGNHAMYKNKKYDVVDATTVTTTWFNRMGKELKEYYFKEYLDIRTVTHKINKPLFFDDYINLCPNMKHKYKPYSEFSTPMKEKVNMMLKFIKDVWCASNDPSTNDKSYEFSIKWLANMIKGNKNESALYLKSPFQGLGKSTVQVFIRDHVIGNDLCLESGSEPLKSKFNEILGGKLFVIFEELETMGIAEWSSISSRLKRQITSRVISLEGKGTNPYTTENMNNYMLVSNNDAIKDDEGRRYFILDLSTEFVGNEEYFNKLYDSCFNDEVGHAFYCYMLEIDTNKFNSQGYPMTQGKADSIAKRLDSVYRFLKNCYILKSKDISSTVNDLHIEYKVFCTEENIRHNGKIDFNKKLGDIGIKYYAGSGGTVNKYKKSHAELKEIGLKFKWIHELDEFVDESECIQTKTSSLDFGIKQDLAIANINDGILKELEQLKKENAELKAMLEKNKIQTKSDVLENPIVEETIIVKPNKKKHVQTVDELDAECHLTLEPIVKVKPEPIQEIKPKPKVIKKKVKIIEAFNPENITKEQEDEFEQMAQLMMIKK